MKSFRKQFCECNDNGFLKNTIFKSFEDHPELLPALPGLPKLRKMMEAINSGEMKGITIYECGRFGGECSSGHSDCRKMRGFNKDCGMESDIL